MLSTAVLAASDADVRIVVLAGGADATSARETATETSNAPVVVGAYCSPAGAIDVALELDGSGGLGPPGGGAGMRCPCKPVTHSVFFVAGVAVDSDADSARLAATVSSAEC